MESFLDQINIVSHRKKKQRFIHLRAQEDDIGRNFRPNKERKRNNSIPRAQKSALTSKVPRERGKKNRKEKKITHVPININPSK
jgi:hypothetical protein